jgi:hypothetical protein
MKSAIARLTPYTYNEIKNSQKEDCLDERRPDSMGP